ncbi:MAG TPA: hypothetical protein DCQ67_06970 [Acidimicrobiaceae bacterium]|nr:hypothetical protein [Acidimicrobiaceae bacterium]
MDVGGSYIGSSEFDPRLDKGAVVYGRWLGRTIDANRWSQPKIISLCKRVISQDKSYVHSSQLSQLRIGGLKSPGPRSIAVIVYLMHAIEDFQKGVEREDSPDWTGLEDLIQDATIMRDDDGNPASIGYHFEVFCGWRMPPGPVAHHKFSNSDAEVLSKSAGKYVRHLMAADRMDLIDDMDSLKKAFSSDKAMQAKFADVMMGQDYWSADEIMDNMQNMTSVLKVVFNQSRKVEELIKQLS